MSYRTQFFALQELVPPEIYEARGERAWELFDVRALEALDALRRRYGPITVNTWSWGGGYTESGYRTLTTPTGAKLSQHRFGRAFDCKFKDTTPQAVHQDLVGLLARAQHMVPSGLKLITTIENTEFTPTWLHFDVRNNVGHEGLRVVGP